MKIGFKSESFSSGTYSAPGPGSLPGARAARARTGPLPICGRAGRGPAADRATPSHRLRAENGTGMIKQPQSPARH